MDKVVHRHDTLVGVKTIFEIFYKIHYRAEKFTVRLYKSDYPSALFEMVWRDFEVFLKDTHTLELLKKAKKKLLKNGRNLGTGAMKSQSGEMRCASCLSHD